ncbi:AAA domain-containing protein [Streptomyces sp. 3MP-14]|uniref:AAA domain-containing protein n=1 Tax=Streptomyces mimosae TaxID=2586635 RepID=A0A5N6AD73_9ACTN|nr:MULTISPECIES: AAA family ATPase [Streptomyces]KAB8165720.1 AAA domain-containing protein [Streptomyces mimosae]KAB8176109.1 AAA domain-containing protein [Streptomyces sp. 3MP-14]
MSGPPDGHPPPREQPAAEPAEPAETQDREGAALANPLVPLWSFSLGWEMERGRQVILGGQVRDRWWWNGAPASFQELLVTVLVRRGAEVVGWWDPVDGLRFPVPGHRERFEQLMRELPPPRDQPVQPPGPQPAAGQAESDAAAPERGDGAREGARTRRGAAREEARAGLFTPRAARRLTAFDDAVAAARRVAASPRAPVAFVFQDVDHALPVTQPESTAGYLLLRAAMTDAVVPDAATGTARNAVLTVVGDPSRLPEWLWRDDPRVVTLHLGPPDQRERRLWFSLLRDQFRGADEATREDFERLVGATDGLSAWELDALAKTSRLRRVPVDRHAELMRKHRLNVTVDPWAQLDRGRIAAAAEELAADVIGQDRAVDAVVGALQAAYVGVDFGDSGAARPRGTFFFVGPTGVGKTELAKSLARLIFGDPGAYARFDMSEYQQEHAAERLAGAPPGFVGYERGGELTGRVQERPFSVLLFDEIEKAHPAVLDKFLQILEDGRLTDGHGRTAHFAQTLIVFTSNVGADALPELLAETGEDTEYAALEAHFASAVEERFRAIGRPEIFGRLKPGIVVFDMLRRAHIVRIADRLLSRLADTTLERRQIHLEFDRPSLHAWITERMVAPERRAYGGRQIRNELEAVRLAVVRYLMERQPPAGARLLVSVVAPATEDGEHRVHVDEFGAATVSLAKPAPGPRPA